MAVIIGVVLLALAAVTYGYQNLGGDWGAVTALVIVAIPIALVFEAIHQRHNR